MKEFAKSQIIELEKNIEKSINIESIKSSLKNIDIFFKEDDIHEAEEYIDNRKVLIKNLLYKLLKKYENGNEKPLRIQRIIKRNLYNFEKLNNILIKYPKINLNIGKIPKCFFKNIEIKEKKYVSKEIYKILTEFSTELNLNYENEFYETENIIRILGLNQKLQIFTEQLSALLKQKISIKK